MNKYDRAIAQMEQCRDSELEESAVNDFSLAIEALIIVRDVRAGGVVAVEPTEPELRRKQVVALAMVIRRIDGDQSITSRTATLEAVAKGIKGLIGNENRAEAFVEACEIGEGLPF